MATQKGRNWSGGDIVTAANLSSVERGVSAMAEEYTPTTWSNGDTVTATALNNIEQGIVSGGGGGGSSDLTTAEVTFVMSTLPTNYKIWLANATDIADYASAVFPDIVEGGTYQTILYKGKGFCLIDGVSVPTITVSGNIESFDGYYAITGDCTITISDSSSVEAQ